MKILNLKVVKKLAMSSNKHRDKIKIDKLFNPKRDGLLEVSFLEK